jgi:aspartate/methionine/tyrosine aminotransferase
MRYSSFALERYFARHEFSARYLLCSSDGESVRLGELLDLESGARERFEALWLGYTESQGAPTLREAIASTYEATSAAQILVHSGAEEAIFNFGHSVLAPGDHVIVQWPCYQSLAEVPRQAGAGVSRWEADPERGWELDLSALSKLLRPETRAIVVNTPHNPTGFQFARDSFGALVDFARRHGLLLFVDEVYRGLEHAPETRLPAVCDVYEKGVSLGVMSKSLGLPGLRIGWIATHDRDVFERMAAFKDYLTICNSAPSEFLATLALRHREKLLDRNRRLAVAHLRLLDAFFERHRERFRCVLPKAGCIAFPRLRSGDAEALAERALDRAGVLLAPGKQFDYAPEFFRIGFGRANFPEALERFESVLT